MLLPVKMGNNMFFLNNGENELTFFTKYAQSFIMDSTKANSRQRRKTLMKKFATLMLALMMLLSCAALGMAEDITLDVIICQYGPKTNDWFTGTGMNGTSFVKKFEEANPGIKLNLEVVS